MSEPLSGVRISVTGAGGFLGPHVVEALARRGALVQAIIGPPGEPARSPAAAHSVGRADILDAAALCTLLEGSQLVVHLAGPASVAASFQDPARTVRVHAEGTATLLEACRAARVSQVVYVSSAEVYGQPLQSPLGEAHRLSARSPYGAAKICAEQLVEAQVHARGVRAVILRPFSIYGPGASTVSLIPRILGLARSGQPIALRDLRPVRDYCFVTDLAEAVAAASALQGEGLEVFNIGTGKGTSVLQLARLALLQLGANSAIQEGSERDRPGQSEILELICDPRRARERLGWEPRVSLEEGLRRTIASLEGASGDVP